MKRSARYVCRPVSPGDDCRRCGGSLKATDEDVTEELPKISAKSHLARAIRYALGRMPKARPYLDHGLLELDNNTAKRAMKPVDIGRKNWMFAQLGEFE